MVDLRSSSAPAHAVAVEDISRTVAAVARLLGLRDYFSFDFRVDAEGRAFMLEFEVCPAVTIYDFQSYLRGRHGKSLGEALALSMSRAFNARLRAAEA